MNVTDSFTRDLNLPHFSVVLPSNVVLGCQPVIQISNKLPVMSIVLQFHYFKGWFDDL